MRDQSPLRSLYEDGLYLTAYERSKEWGPLSEWKGTTQRILAGQLATQLGNRRLGDALFLRTWRGDKRNAPVAAFAAMSTLRSRGPLPAWRLLRQSVDCEFCDPSEQADFYAAHVSVLAVLRDFSQAEQWLEKAMHADPQNAWLGVERAVLFESEDRIDESLAVARRNFEHHPRHRPSIEMLAHSLTLHNRIDEAIGILSDAADRLESYSIVLQLAQLLVERHCYDAVDLHLTRIEELTPLREPRLNEWLSSIRLYLAARAGNRQRFAKLLEQSSLEEQKKAYDRFLRAPADARRVELPVNFVRQHYQTCGPATLASISQYWSRPFEHLQIAERICYDGTPAHSERQWAEQNGWYAREFTITEETAVQLIDRGFPFTVTLVGATHAHLCAAIGYDARLGTLLVRDPSQPQSEEISIEGLLVSQASNGPRGMVLAPPERIDELSDVELVDAELYDRLHEVQRGLEKHDRSRAEKALTELVALDPDHRLTLTAERSLAVYDLDHRRVLATVEKLLAKYPEDANYRQMKLQGLRIVSRFKTRRGLLKEWSNEGKEPVFWKLRAEDLMRDARRWRESRKLLKRALRARPMDAGVMLAMAGLAWSEHRREEAVELYRFASCLEDKDQSAALSYFRTSRDFGGCQDAIKLLEDCYRRFGHKSDQPVQSLFLACEEIGNLDRAFEVLEETLTRRAEDGALMLFAADKFASIGKFDRANDLLERSCGYASTRSRTETRAQIVQRRGDLRQATALWREIAEQDEGSYVAASSLARLLMQTEGGAEAVKFLRQAIERRPRDFGLQQLLVDYLREGSSDIFESAVRRLVEIDPRDAWSVRELAMIAARQGKMEEAKRASDFACEAAPNDPRSLTIRGLMLVRADERDPACKAFREALLIDPDDRYALASLMTLTTRRDEQEKELSLLFRRLFEPDCHGPGILNYAGHALGVLTHERILDQLTDLHQVRPELCQSWSALSSHLVQMNQLVRAREIAEEAAKRFSYLPSVWLDLAGAAAAQNDSAGRRRAADKALERDPCCVAATCILAEILLDEAKWTQASRLLEAAVAQIPLDARLHSLWAQALWKLSQRDEAIEHMELAARIAPAFDRAWAALADWCARRNDGARVLRAVREVVAESAGDPHAWLRLSATLPTYRLEERLRAVNEAILLDPLLDQAYDLRAELLAVNGRFSEAESACRPALWGSEPPFPLRGRSAWIAAERGDVELAIDRMESVVKDVPDYTWGWNYLTRWYSFAGLNEKAQNASRRRALPAAEDASGSDSTALATRAVGESDAVNQDQMEGKGSDAPWGPAGLAMVDELLASGDVSAVSSAILSLGDSVEKPDLLTRSIRLHCAQGQFDQALDCFREMLALRDVDQTCYESAVGTIADHRDVAEVFDVLRSKTDPSNLSQRWAWSAVLDREIAASPRTEKALMNEAEHILAIAGKMAKHWPQDALSQAYLAHGYLMNGEKEKARTCLEKALIADPSSRYVARNLMEILFEKEDFEAAAEVARQVEDHTPANLIQAWRVVIAARAGKREAAAAHFAELCGNEIDDMATTRLAYDEMLKSGLQKEMLEEMEAAFTAVRVNPSIGALWVEARLARLDEPLIEKRLDAFAKQGLMGAQAIVAYLGTLANAKKRRLLNRTIDKYEKELNGYAESWGAVGACLIDAKDSREAEDWLSTYDARAGARPWMLYNLSIALRNLKRDEACLVVHERALDMNPDNTTPLHRVLRAYEYAVFGSVDEANSLLAGVDLSSLGAWHRHVYHLANACAKAHSARVGGPHYRFEEIKRTMEAANAAAPRTSDLALLRLHRRALRSISDAVGPQSALWYFRQRYNPSPWTWWIMLPILLNILRVLLENTR